MSRREVLLDKAEELFSECGFEGTSIRLLAKEAGMNIAMISYYFGSKEKLFESLVEDRTSAIRERLKLMSDQDESPMVRLEEMIRLFVDRIVTRPRFHRLLLHEISINTRPELQRRIAEVLMRNIYELRRIIRDGIDQGLFREVDIDMTILTLIGTVNQLISASDVLRQSMLAKPSDSVEGHELTERLYQHLRELMFTHLKKNANQ